MLAFGGTGTQFTSEFGDIDEPFYNGLSSVLREIDQVLKGERGPELYQGIRERVLELPKLAGGIGRGYGDEIRETVDEWERRFGEE